MTRNQANGERVRNSKVVSPIRIYDGVLSGLASISGVMLALLFIAVVYDVTLRNLGFHPPRWTSTMVEYGLLYLTVLAAPWLLRHHGHISVDTFLGYMSPKVRKFLTTLSCLVGALSCGLFAAFALRATLIITGDDLRSITIPRWIILAPLPVGFGLLSIEFVRQAVMADISGSGIEGKH